jgi:hypothetical protein
MIPESMDVTPQPAPFHTIQIPRRPPVITNVRVETRAASFDVCVEGFSSSREVVEATFDFEPAAGRTLGTFQLKPSPSSNEGCAYRDLAGLFSCWFQAPGRGGVFTYVQTFNVTGSLSDIGAVAVTLSNREAGASPRERVNFTSGSCQP